MTKERPRTNTGYEDSSRRNYNSPKGLDWIRILVFWDRLKVEHLFHNERIHLWFIHPTRIPVKHLLGEVFSKFNLATSLEVMPEDIKV